MRMTPAYLSGRRLLEIDRYQEAAAEFRRHLSQEPNDASGHAFLAVCLVELEQHQEAKAEARRAIELDPEEPFVFFAQGLVLLKQNRAAEARDAFREAIRLAPEAAAFHGQLGVAEMHDKRWSQALEAANQGLAFDPEDTVCLNVRSSALTQLGRRGEAASTIQDALAKEPENAWTHANHGWAELHAGHPKVALIHFREALRIEPENEFARQGIVEALKARNIVYRGLLSFALWMTRLPPGWRWAVVAAIFLAPRMLKGIGNAAPGIAWFTKLLGQGILVFVLMTWIAAPLFNLLLRLDRFGRHALSQDQTRGANLLAVFLFPALGLWVASWFARAPYDETLLVVAVALGVNVLPASVLFACDRGWPRFTMLGYLIALFLLSSSVILAIVVENLGILDRNEAILRLVEGAVLPVAPLVFYSPLATFFLAQWLINAKVKR